MMNNRETVADVVAQMRGRGEDGRMDRQLWRDYADRIEAAWKRDEERAVEHATRHAEAVARDNCRDCVYNPNGKNHEPGNAAAMREALTEITERIIRIIGCDHHAFHPYTPCDFKTSMGECMHKMICETIFKAKSALSAPARNCDMYLTQPEMSMAYEVYRKAAMKRYGNGLTGRVPTIKQKPMTYDEWMFAPAAERKGEVE